MVLWFDKLLAFWDRYHDYSSWISLPGLLPLASRDHASASNSGSPKLAGFLAIVTGILTTCDLASMLTNS